LGNLFAVGALLLATFSLVATCLTVWANQQQLNRAQRVLETKTDKETADANFGWLRAQLDECIKARDDFGKQVRHLQDEAAQFRRENYTLYQQNFKLQGDLAVLQQQVNKGPT